MVAVERNGIRAGKGSHEARTIEWAYRFPKRPEVDVDPLVPGVGATALLVLPIRLLIAAMMRK